MNNIIEKFNSIFINNYQVKNSYVDECLEKYIDASYRVNKFIYRGLDERYKKVFVECIIPEPIDITSNILTLQINKKLNKNISIDNCRNINNDYIKCDVYDK